MVSNSVWNICNQNLITTTKFFFTNQRLNESMNGALDHDSALMRLYCARDNLGKKWRLNDD